MLDFVDEDEIKEDIRCEVRSQIKQQITTLIDNNKTEIQKELINKIIKELINTIDFGEGLKEVLYNKIVDGIERRYNENDAFYITYDMDIDKIIKEIYSNNKENIDNLLLNKMNDALNKYRVNDYIFSDKLSEMITNDDKYKTTLKEMLDDRLCDILDKI